MCHWLQIKGSRVLIPVRSHTYVVIDHKIFSKAILLPSAEARVDQAKVPEVLFNRLAKLAQEKSVIKWTGRPDITTAVDWDVKNQTKPNQVSPL